MQPHLKTKGIAISLLWALVIAGCGKDKYEIANSYKDFAEAQREGALKVGGWLPKWLPVDAKGIRERHNVENNSLWIYFECGAESRAALLLRFSERVDAKILGDHVAVPVATWWPPDAANRDWRKGEDGYLVGFNSTDMSVIAVGDRRP